MLGSNETCNITGWSLSKCEFALIQLRRKAFAYTSKSVQVFNDGWDRALEVGLFINKQF